ncbi:TetR/AcrR family transcriptional regulator [Capillimicrobium parvum]|uniref:HTH-type transcriptional regulator BetI n=1 Tax=Capillimicrobium parvum TaxID=2884022 RepID=A0A9E6XZU9_9ACTN|nr:TetR/AcrR family transcriptional regulator [Capillimicrobium parvum]UGS36831.1 HTH-type transcriptional regulator BetI [Capillimicrobium parvum]
MSAADRRAAILDAAMEAFATRGYHGTSLDDVAAAAGVSKALIYEHFSSKQNLHDTLISVQAGELFGRLAAAADPELAAEQRLRGGVDVFFGFVEERREAWRALFRDAADPHLGEVVEHVQRQATAAIAELMLAGTEPQAAHQDVEMVALMLSGAVQALANWWYDHQDVPRSVLVDRVMAFAWLGLGRLSGEGA